MRYKNIAAIILTFFAGMGIAWWKLSERVYHVAKEIASELVTEVTDNIYPCKLMVFYQYNQEEESIVTDFTHYKEKGLIGLLISKKESPPNETHKEIDGKPLYYKNAVVYKLGDTWLWQKL